MAKRILIRSAMLLALFVMTISIAEAEREIEMPDRFIDELARKGYIVQEGKVDFPKIGTMCCKCDLPICYANNPSSPYGIFVLPPAPNQPSSVKNPYSEWFSDGGYYPEGEDWSWFFRQRADEAIVFIGTTPPEMDYFGITGYIYDRYKEGITPPACIYIDHEDNDIEKTKDPPVSALNRFPLFASVGDTINNGVINVAGNKANPFNEDVVIIVATDRRIEQEIRKTLLKAGYPDKIINTIVVSPSLVRLGVELESDSFLYLMRLASEITPELQKYMDSNLRVFRVSPYPPVPISSIDPLESPALRVRGTGETEVDLLPAVDELGKAIVEKYSALGYSAEKVVAVNFFTGYNCIENGDMCQGDNRDTPYIGAGIDPVTKEPAQELRLGPDDFYIAYGVNHQKTDKATYTNVSVLGWTKKFSPVVFINDEMPGSAYSYLGSSINSATQDKLYALKVTRPGGCGGDYTYCREVDYSCEGGIAADDPITLVSRAYLEPETMVGADYGEIIIDRVIKFTK